MRNEKRVEFQAASSEQVEELRGLSERYIKLAQLQEKSGYELIDVEAKKRIGLQNEIALAFVSHKAGTHITYGNYLDFKASLLPLIQELEVIQQLSKK